MGVDFLVYRAILAYFAYVTLELLVGKITRITQFCRKSKKYLIACLFFVNRVPRPVRDIRATRGGLEPSANFPDKLDS